VASQIIGALRAVLSAETADFEAGFKRAGALTNNLSTELSNLNKPLTSIGKDFAKVGLGIAGAAAAVGGAVAFATKRFLDLSDGLVTMADKSGTTVEWLQKTKYAAEQSGTTLEAVVASTGKLQKALAEGSRDTVEAVNALGLSFQDLRNSSPDEQMDKVLAAISKVADPTERTALAVKLLGRSGADLIPLAGNFEELKQKAEELGLVMSEKDVRAAEALGDSIDSLFAALGGLVNNVVAVITSSQSLHVLIEGLTNIFASLSSSVSGNRQMMADLVSQGVLLLAKGLVFLVDVVQVGINVWDALRLTWLSLYNVALQLALGFATVELAWAKLTGDKQAVADNALNIKLIEAEIAANARAVTAVEESNTAKTNAVQGFRAQLVELEKQVAAAAGKEVELGEKAKQGGAGVQAMTAEMKKAAEEALKMSQDLDKAIGQAQAASQEGLAGDFAKIGVDAEAQLRKIDDLLRKGLDPASAAALAQQVTVLTRQLEDNAVAAARQQILGETFKDVQVDAQNLLSVLAEFEARGGSLKDLTDEALGALAENLKKAVQNGAPLTAQLEEVNGLLKERGILSKQEEAAIDSALEAQHRYWDTVDQEIEEAKYKLQDFYSDLYGVANLLATLGAPQLGESLAGAVDWMQQFDAAAEDGVLAWGEIANLAAGAAAQFQRATDSASAMSRALGGALTGAGIGSKIGGLFGPVGAAVGAGVGAIAGAIGGIFNKPELDGVGKKWGVDISEGLAKQIEADAKEIGDKTAAILKNLPSIIEEAGGIESFGVDKAVSAAHDLFSQIETGKLSVAEAVAAFDEVFGQLIPHAIDKTTGFASDAFLELIELNERFGTKSAEVAKFLEQQAGAGVQSLNKLSESIVVSEASAAGLGAAVVAQFQALRDQGLTAREAMEQLQPSIDNLRKKFEELGISGGPAFDVLAAQSALAADETAGPLIDGINAAGAALAALHNQGVLTQESFTGLTTSIGETYAKLQEQGQAGPAALALIQPDLQRVWELQRNFGYEVDAATQALLDEAVASGQVGEAHMSAQDRMTEATERTATAIETLVRALGVDLPTAARRGADGVEKAFGGIQIPPIDVEYRTRTTGSGAPGGESEPLPEFARGGVGDFGVETMALLHGPEAIIPLDRLDRLLSRAMGAGRGQGGGTTVVFQEGAFQSELNIQADGGDPQAIAAAAADALEQRDERFRGEIVRVIEEHEATA